MLCTVHISGTCSNWYDTADVKLTLILQSSAQNALDLHGRELEPGRPLSVLISNPERKKERTDAEANEKEIYVAGLSKFTTKEDLIKLFTTVCPDYLLYNHLTHEAVVLLRSMVQSKMSEWLLRRMVNRKVSLS